MSPEFLKKIQLAHQHPKTLPGEKEIDAFITKILQFLFPELGDVRLDSILEIQTAHNLLQLQFEELLKKTKACDPECTSEITNSFFKNLEKIYNFCVEDAKAITSGDPAAYNDKEVIRTYPGFFAIAIYRIANSMYKLDIPYLPRIFTEYAHSRSGIDIHPGATIGRKFCIDHGTGVVIGETTIIGNNVKIYQGVTLGALSVRKDMAQTKRHPTIEDNVIIYAGATILGGETTIGKNSIIGGNVWITESVPPDSRVYYQSKDTVSY